MALFKLAFACLRKAPREFLGIAIAYEEVSMFEGKAGKGGPRNRVTCDSNAVDDDDCGVGDRQATLLKL